MKSHSPLAVLAAALLVLIAPDWERYSRRDGAERGPGTTVADRLTRVLVLPVRWPLPAAAPVASPPPATPPRVNVIELLTGLKNVRDQVRACAIGVTELPDAADPGGVGFAQLSAIPVLLPATGERTATGETLRAEWRWLAGLGPRLAAVDAGEAPGGRRVRLTAPDPGLEALPLAMVRLALPAADLRVTGDHTLSISLNGQVGALDLEEGSLPVRPLARAQVMRPWPAGDGWSAGAGPVGERSLLILGRAPDAGSPRALDRAVAVASAIEQILDCPLRPAGAQPSASSTPARISILLAAMLGWISGGLLALPRASLASAAFGGFVCVIGSLSWISLAPMLAAGGLGVWAARVTRREVPDATCPPPSGPERLVRDIPPALAAGFDELVALGQGGMGMVYSGRDRSTGDRVIVKVMRPEFRQDKDYHRRFMREMEALSMLDHPNIIRVLSLDRSALFFVMELFPSQDMKSLLERAGTLAPERVARIGEQVAMALEVAHAAGILHRDVKPENILVGDGGQAKLIDFGLAMMTARTAITQEGATLGTLLYMAPEVLEGNPHTAQSDLYSLGMVLYQGLTGVIPYSDNVYVKVAYGPLPTPADVVPSLDPRLSDLVMRCLERPEKRWKCAEQLVADFAQLAGGRPRTLDGA